MLSGPMFEKAQGEIWRSVHNKEGGHYNVFTPKDSQDIHIAPLLTIFPEGECNELNFVLFGTSGVHGTYTRVDDLRASYEKYGILSESELEHDFPDDYHSMVTFLVVQPRLCTLRYGNVVVTSEEDIKLLERMRDTSAEAVKEYFL